LQTASGARRITSDNSISRPSAPPSKVCRTPVLKIVEDGEGAQRVIEVEVRGAPSDRAATHIARTIANSPLVNGPSRRRPQLGRILRCRRTAGVPFDFELIDIKLAGILVCRRGGEHPFSERVAHKKMLAKYVPIVVECIPASARARLTCDFTREYVDINASYRTYQATFPIPVRILSRAASA
jgi:glutamate N-acetyltransferase/amino-acid N-acetyltransferase